MNSKIFYKMMAGFYDLIDVIYFRKKGNNPRKVVFSAIKDGETVLDLCTGTATNALNIAKKYHKSKVTGIDLSTDMLRVAEEKVKSNNVHNLKLYCMDATNMKFKSGSFDKILLSLVLHEVEDELATKLLEEAKRVLKDEGELIVTEWERSDNFIQKVVFFPIKLLEPRPFKMFINKDLNLYFAEHGFDVVEYKHCDYSRVLRLKKTHK